MGVLPDNKKVKAMQHRQPKSKTQLGRLNIYLSPEQKDKIQNAALAKGLSTSALVASLIDEYLS